MGVSENACTKVALTVCGRPLSGVDPAAAAKRIRAENPSEVTVGAASRLKAGI